MASFFVFEKKNKEIKNEADKVFCALFVFYSSISIHILSKRKYNKQGKNCLHLNVIIHTGFIINKNKVALNWK